MEWFPKNKTQTFPTKFFETTSMTWSKSKNPNMKQILETNLWHGPLITKFKNQPKILNYVMNE
jgi:hypothetical protein